MDAKMIVHISPNPVDAGAEFTLNVAIKCDPPWDMCTGRLSICDTNEHEITQLVLTEFKDQESRGSTVLSAPAKPGPAKLKILFKADHNVGLTEDMQTEVLLVIPPHASSVAVWDVPPAIQTEKEFSFYVGLRCSAGCALKGRPLEVFDQNDRIVATAITTGTWGDTQALHYAKITLVAPNSLGTYEWRVCAPSSGLEVPHSRAVLKFPVTFVREGKYEIRINATNALTGKVIPKAQVVAHPFRSITDSDGNATLCLPAGEYRLLVSAADHEPYIIEGTVKDDMEIMAVLVPETDMTEIELEREYM